MTGKSRLFSVLSVLILLFSCHNSRLALLKNTNSSSTSRYRSLLQSLSQETIASSHYISHHHGHNIPGTSTPSLPHILKTMIENVTSTTLNVSDTSPAFIKSVRASLQQLLVEDLSHDSTKKAKLLQGINYDSRLTARAHSLHGLGAQSDETLSDLVDIVIPITSISDASMNFLSDWKDFIKDLHAIIILARGISLQSLTVPEWLDYIVYTRSDVERVLAEDSWLIPTEVLLLLLLLLCIPQLLSSTSLSLSLLSLVIAALFFVIIMILLYYYYIILGLLNCYLCLLCSRPKNCIYSTPQHGPFRTLHH